MELARQNAWTVRRARVRMEALRMVAFSRSRSPMLPIEWEHMIDRAGFSSSMSSLRVSSWMPRWSIGENTPVTATLSIPASWILLLTVVFI